MRVTYSLDFHIWRIGEDILTSAHIQRHNLPGRQQCSQSSAEGGSLDTIYINQFLHILHLFKKIRIELIFLADSQ